MHYAIQDVIYIALVAMVFLALFQCAQLLIKRFEKSQKLKSTRDAQNLRKQPR